MRAELDGYAENAANGAIDRSFAAKVVGKLNAKIEEVQRRIAAAVTPPALAGDPGEDVADRWNPAPISARREVLRLLTTSIGVVIEVAPAMTSPGTVVSGVHSRSEHAKSKV